MSYKRKNLKIFLLALVVAVLAAFIVRQILFRKIDREEQAARDVVTVLVSKADIGIGEKITGDSFKWVKWPRDSVSPEYITDKKDLEKIEGAIVRDAIISGEPVKQTAVVHVGEQGVLAAVITPGKRAFTILLKRTTNITPLISPGDFVDVIVAARSDDRKTYEGKTVIRHVRVLEIDGKFEKTKKGTGNPPRSITVEVAEEDAEALAAALREGEPTISLYSFGGEGEGRKKHKRRLAENSPTQETSSLPPVSPQETNPPVGRAEGGLKEHKVTIFRGDKIEERTFKKD